MHWLAGGNTRISAGLVLGGVVAVVALACGRWLHLSHHVAYASYASLLLWPWFSAVAFALAVTAGIAWSRLALGRHHPGEILVGLITGLAAGVGYLLLGR